jgi:glycosyltransferase involved in cell wall biosynthesis
MVDSIHVARWIAQFEPNEVEFTLFPSTPNRRVHSMIKEMMSKNGNITIVPFGGKLSIPLWGMDLIFSDYVRGLLLRRVLRRQKPDFVHALELQHGGYVTNRALEDSSINTQFIATNYGSDIYWFQQFPKHLDKIEKLLARADRYSAECNRDVNLAQKYGFTGEVLPVFPNAGGFTEEQLSRPMKSPSERKVIAIKGYNNWVGRADVAIQAIVAIREQLSGFQVVVYSCSRLFYWKLKRVRKLHKLEMQLHLKGSLSHEKMQNLFASSRIYVGLSDSDGISTSMLEAMSNGAFPIQSSTACLDEWITPNVGGYSIKVIERRVVASKILEALGNDDLVDEAAKSNRVELVRRLVTQSVAQRARQFYF